MWKPWEAGSRLSRNFLTTSRLCYQVLPRSTSKTAEWHDLVEPAFLRQLVVDNLYKPDCQKSDASEIRPERIRRDSESYKC